MLFTKGRKCEICERELTVLNAGPEFEKNLCACCYATIKCTNEEPPKGKKFDRRTRKSPFEHRTLHEVYFQGLKDGVMMYAYSEDKEKWVGKGEIKRKLNDALDDIEEAFRTK